MKAIPFGLALAASLTCTSYAQNDINYVKRQGLNWIMPSNAVYAFKAKIDKVLPAQACEAVLNFTSANELIKSCKEGDELVCTDKIKDHLANKARRHAFGRDFDGSAGTEQKSLTSDWRIFNQFSPRLKPELISEYAAQLGIDPNESVVSTIAIETLTPSSNKTLAPMFRPYAEGTAGGSSFFFNQDIPIVNQGDESQVYLKESALGAGHIGISSRILNCEMQNYPEEFVGIPVNFTTEGRRHVTAEQGSEVYEAYRKVATESFPDGTSETHKALIYGYLLAKNVNNATTSQIGLNYIIDKLFDTTGDSIRIKPSDSAEAMTENLKVLATYEQKDIYINLYGDRGD